MSKVFIIDDDSIHQRIAQIMIEKHNLFDSCNSFTDGLQALDYLKKDINNAEVLPDVILLDLNMPVMDGWEFLEVFESLRAQLKRQIRIYIVTSSVDEKDKLRSQAYTTVKGFISKPLSPEVIRTTC